MAEVEAGALGGRGARRAHLHDVLLLAVLDGALAVDALERVDLARLAVLDEEHAPPLPRPQSLLRLEVGELHAGEDGVAERARAVQRLRTEGGRAA